MEKPIKTKWNDFASICNVLNEVCHGIYVENFNTVIGFEYKIIYSLLNKIGKHEVTESKADKEIFISLNENEISIIQNCFKKVLNEIDDWEFSLRIGVSKEEIKKIMRKLENF